MRLTSVQLEGYKRFKGRTTMKVDGKLVAIVGANEAGKTSFLQALQHLNHSEPFSSTGSSRELSRGSDIRQGQKIVKSTYLLDEEDKEVINHIPEANLVKRLTVSKKAGGGTFIASVDPTPERDMTLRRKTLREVVSSTQKRKFRDLAEASPEHDFSRRFAELRESLESDAHMLEEEVREEIRALLSEFADAISEHDPKYLLQLSEQLNKWIADEDRDFEAECRNALFKRRPTFLFFSPGDLDLRSEYSIGQVVSDTPKALGNLVQVAELDLGSLNRAVQEEDRPEASNLLDRANATLERKFRESWTQSDVSVVLRNDEDLLSIFVRENGVNTSIAERSEGLRQFIALLAFATVEQSSEESILLIDEAETHLHYDAQADLVQMLTKQDVVAKVIYTTHSVGCLPEDLGLGVRLVEPDPKNEGFSRVHNWFWHEREPGYSPLLYGMGARTLAFVPIRNAVFVEGASDMILWPSLFREVANLTYLDFHIAPGLSESSPTEIGALDQQAKRTAYLVDSDKDGRKLAKQLIDAGIDSKRVFELPSLKGGDTVLEDVIDPDTYTKAINDELARWNNLEARFPKGRLPESNRPAEVTRWCKKRGLTPPSKTTVAYRILDSASGSLVADKYRSAILDLCKRIRKVLQAPSESQTL